MDPERGRLYKLFMSTEKHAIHSDSAQVFERLGMDDTKVAALFIEVLHGPPNAFEDRMRDALDELVCNNVTALVDEEMGVD